MKKTLFSLVMALVLSISFSMAGASEDTAENRGKKLFNNPAFAGGKTACNSCHSGGEDIIDAASKTTFYVFSEFQNNLEEVINICITNGNMGKAIAPDSKEMKDMISYLKSLGKKSDKK